MPARCVALPANMKMCAGRSRGGEIPRPAIFAGTTSLRPTLGTGGSLGPPAVYQPAGALMVLLGAVVAVGGTLDVGETITIELTSIFDDNTSASINLSATATGIITLTESQIQILSANPIASIQVRAGSSAPSTNADVSVSLRTLEIIV